MHSKPYIKITKFVKTEGDPQFRVEGASVVRITNHGQTRVWIDEDEVLEPGESFEEGDVTGPGIQHTYNLTFTTNPSPPAADEPYIYAGSRLHIRLLQRIENAI